MPWRLLIAVTVLFVAVQVAHDYGVGDALGAVAGEVGDRFAATLQLAGVSAVGVPVRWRTFAVRGLMVVPILLISCVAALALAS